VRFPLPVFERIFRDGGGDEERETKPHPQPFAFLVSQASRTATYGSPKREGSSYLLKWRELFGG